MKAAAYSPASANPAAHCPNHGRFIRRSILRPGHVVLRQANVRSRDALLRPRIGCARTNVTGRARDARPDRRRRGNLLRQRHGLLREGRHRRRRSDGGQRRRRGSSGRRQRGRHRLFRYGLDRIGLCARRAVRRRRTGGAARSDRTDELPAGRRELADSHG